MMDAYNKDKMSKALQSLKVQSAELVSTYNEGYIGKNVYKVTLIDGSTRMCEQITKNGKDGDAVVIIPITQDGNFVMIVQSRPNTKETVVVEFPAGMVDEGEDFIVSAERELLEETGYQASEIYELESHYQDQGCSKAIIKTFVAVGCRKIQEKKLDGSEKLDYMEMSYDDILSMIKSDTKGPKIKDANTKIAFMEYTLKKRGVL
ncbi:MAG: NUDIX hydrolase [Bacilli bacterium]|nr:NUDIX hydrolase [Bacilli bacterium]